MENILTQIQAPAGAKMVTAKFASGRRQPETLFVMAGTTAGDVLSQLGLGPDFQLSKGTPDTVFGQDEAIFGRLQDGDLIFVTSRVDAGTC